MFKHQILNLIILILIHEDFVTASPPLIPRQDIWRSFDWGKAIENIVNGLGSLGSGLMQNSNPPDKSTTDAPPTDSASQSNAAVPGTSGSPNNPSSNTNQSPDFAPFTDTDPLQSTDNCENAGGCDKPVDRIIFTSSCATMNPDQVITDEIRAQNQGIWNRLVEMAPSLVRKSVSKVCDVIFFVAPLTRQQRDELLKLSGVRLIIPNSCVRLDSAIPRSRKEKHSTGASTGSKRGHVQKRDFIASSLNAPPNMKFVSTPEGHEGLADAFYYYSASGRDTRIFTVGLGVQIGHDEFVLHPRPPVREYLFALDTGPEPKPDKLATCAASIMSGYKTGMLKNADLIPIEIHESAASILDALNIIIEYIRSENRVRALDPGAPLTKGYVALLRFSWDDDEKYTEEVKSLFQILIRELNVVLVAVAWPDLSYQRSAITDYPALLASNDYPIIVAGAADLNGMVEDWSRSGDHVIVHAPSSGLCAANTAGNAIWDAYGPVVPGAHLAALAAYFLSIEETGYLLREDPQGLAWATRAWIERSAYSRLHDGDISCWNRLGPSTPVGVAPD